MPLAAEVEPLPAPDPHPSSVKRVDGLHELGYGLCGFPLAELPARPVPSEVLEVQDLYLRAAAGQALYLAGKDVTPADWFAEMSQLVALARLVGSQEFPAQDSLPGFLPKPGMRITLAGKAGALGCGGLTRPPRNWRLRFCTC